MRIQGVSILDANKLNKHFVRRVFIAENNYSENPTKYKIGAYYPIKRFDGKIYDYEIISHDWIENCGVTLKLQASKIL